MNRFRNLLKRKLNERGDVVQTILMLPIAIFVLFSMINLSSYFSVRADVQTVARNGARLVALYGGDSVNAVRNTAGQNVETIMMNQLYRDNNCTFSYCSQPPTVSCTPSRTALAGDLVSCEVRYYYAPIAPIADGWEGLNGVFSQPMRVSSTSVAETGINGG